VVIQEKPRKYTDGDAEVVVSHHPSGRMRRVYGKYVYPYKYVALFQKQGKPIFTTRFRGDMRVKDIKEMLSDIANVAMPRYFLKTENYWRRLCNR